MNREQHLPFEDVLFLNQAAQHAVAASAFEDWFRIMTLERQKIVLAKLVEMILQAKPGLEDGKVAVQVSGLKPTFTPCVLLSKGVQKSDLNKVVGLPESENLKAAVLLLEVFRQADCRRRQRECGNEERHWWHRDLRDPRVVQEIFEQHRRGVL